MNNALPAIILYGGFVSLFFIYLYLKNNSKDTIDTRPNSVDMFKLRRYAKIIRRCAAHSVVVHKGSLAIIDSKQCDICTKSYEVKHDV